MLYVYGLNLSPRKLSLLINLFGQKLDETYGPAWNCVVGNDFGSCITHLCGSFIFFRVEMMEFLIFKDGKDFTERKEEAIGVLQKAGNEDS